MQCVRPQKDKAADVPLLFCQWPERPWQRVHVDYAEKLRSGALFSFGWQSLEMVGSDADGK